MTTTATPRFTGYIAPCGDDFETARDAKDHEATCGACTGAVEAETLSMDAVVKGLHRKGIAAYVEQTGGGCATIYAGPITVDEDGCDRYAVGAGPGWFQGAGWTNGRADFEDFSVGRDDDGESGEDYSIPDGVTGDAAVAWTVDTIARMIERPVEDDTTEPAFPWRRLTDGDHYTVGD